MTIAHNELNSIAQNEDSIAQNEDSVVHNEASKHENGLLIFSYANLYLIGLVRIIEQLYYWLCSTAVQVMACNALR